MNTENDLPPEWKLKFLWSLVNSSDQMFGIQWRCYEPPSVRSDAAFPFQFKDPQNN